MSKTKHHTTVFHKRSIPYITFVIVNSLTCLLLLVDGYLVFSQPSASSSPPPSSNLYNQVKPDISWQVLSTSSTHVNALIPYPEGWTCTFSAPGLPNIQYSREQTNQKAGEIVSDKGAVCLDATKKDGVYIQTYTSIRNDTVLQFAQNFLDTLLNLYGVEEVQRTIQKQTYGKNDMLVVTTVTKDADGKTSDQTYWFVMDKDLTLVVYPYGTSSKYIPTMLRSMQIEL